MKDATDPTDRTKLGLVLGAGALTVVAVEVVVLIHVATGPGDGFERAAIWAVLLMITVTFLTVAGIGYGFYRDHVRNRGTGGSGRDGGGSPGDDDAGGSPPPVTPGRSPAPSHGRRDTSSRSAPASPPRTRSRDREPARTR